MAFSFGLGFAYVVSGLFGLRVRRNVEMLPMEFRVPIQLGVACLLGTVIYIALVDLVTVEYFGSLSISGLLGIATVTWIVFQTVRSHDGGPKNLQRVPKLLFERTAKSS